MKQTSFLGLALALLAGCSTPQMKSSPFYQGNDREVYTGAVEDRINLWPVAFWREPVGSVAWPLLSFSDDQLALRPLYSQYRQTGKSGAWDEFNLCWPIAQADLRADDYRFFPVLWGGTANKSYECVFPVWFSGRRDGGTEGWNALFPLWICNWDADESSLRTLGGFAGERTRKSGYASSWCFPLWYWNNEGLLATPLYGRTPDSYWFFPLWYRDADTFVSLPISWTGDGKDGGWASPGLLSWGGWEEDGDWNAKILLGMLGAEHRVNIWDASEAEGDAQKAKEPNWCTNVCDEVWCGPLWERRDWQRKGVRGGRQEFLLGCCAWEWDGAGLESAHVFPLFSWDRAGTFYTPLGGRRVNTNACETTTYYTVLAGTREGRMRGGWVFPFWNREKEAGFEDAVARLDAPRLPDEIEVRIEESTNQTGKVAYSRNGTHVSSSDKTTWLLLSDDDTYMWGSPVSAWHEETRPAATNDYELTWSRKRGNELVFNVQENRGVRFSSGTREKIGDKTSDETSLLVWLYESNGTRDRMTGDVYRHRRMLWRLWDWERTNDDVSLDVFPGFTYDAKADGFVKTSLLWRLFRYENDPKAGVSADLLFLPVWRP